MALGVFDGVHLGHRVILGRAVELGRRGGLRAVACTFDPHPMQLLRPEQAPTPITTLAERLDLIGRVGIDLAVVLSFDPALAAMEPERFVADVLVEGLDAREVVVGFNHRFGRGARGDAALLARLAERYEFRSHVVEPLLIEGGPVSSSGIRSALSAGEVERAARGLGRPYAVAGRVLTGAGRGRVLGFATANLEVDRPLLVPRGVYAGWATLAGLAHPAVVNVGVRPTFGDLGLAVEAHLLDFSGDLYGRMLGLSFVVRLRDERRFPDADALRAQIAVDVGRARQHLGLPGFTSGSAHDNVDRN